MHYDTLITYIGGRTEPYVVWATDVTEAHLLAATHARANGHLLSTEVML